MALVRDAMSVVDAEAAEAMLEAIAEVTPVADAARKENGMSDCVRIGGVRTDLTYKHHKGRSGGSKRPAVPEACNWKRDRFAGRRLSVIFSQLMGRLTYSS